MRTKEFNETLHEQIVQCTDVLIKKADEYAGEDDRLHNFKVAAALKGETPRQALAGMMAKHTVSIYDMCKDDTSYSMELWDEKIGDHLNYLFLLKAIVVEEQSLIATTQMENTALSPDESARLMRHFDPDYNPNRS